MLFVSPQGINMNRLGFATGCELMDVKPYEIFTLFSFQEKVTK